MTDEVEGTGFFDLVRQLTEEDPVALIWYAFGVTVIIVLFLLAATIGISRAGKYQPPVVSVALVLGIVSMISLIAGIVRPETASFFILTGVAIGGLSGALGAAFFGDKFIKLELSHLERRRDELVEEMEQLLKQKQQEEADDEAIKFDDTSD